MMCQTPGCISKDEESVNHWTESLLYVIITKLKGKNNTDPNTEKYLG